MMEHYTGVPAWSRVGCRDSQASPLESQPLGPGQAHLGAHMSHVNDPAAFSSYNMTESIVRGGKAIEEAHENEWCDDTTGTSTPTSSCPHAGKQGYDDLTTWGVSSDICAPNMCLVSPYSVPQAGLSPLSKLSCIRCWQHGCEGRSFSNISNYRRHCKEKSELQTKAVCHRCGRTFSRTTSRDLHYRRQRCLLTLLDANGVPFRTKFV
jgi:hypothetical protein